MTTWKLLLAAAVVAPPVAYLVGAVAAPVDEPTHRPEIVLTPEPASQAPPRSSATRSCGPEDDVVVPCPGGDGDQDDAGGAHSDEARQQMGPPLKGDDPDEQDERDDRGAAGTGGDSEDDRADDDEGDEDDEGDGGDDRDGDDD